MTHAQLLRRLQEIADRDSGNVNDDRNDAIEALLEYINDPEVQELFERISEP